MHSPRTSPDPAPDDVGDAPLALRAAGGDRTAFAELVRRHQRGLFGFLGRMGLGQGEAEDLAQECLLRAWCHLDRYDPQRAAYSTWLYTIARRLALNWLDRAEQRLRVELRSDPGDGRDAAGEQPLATDPFDRIAADPAQAAWGADPSQGLALRHRQDWLQAGLRRLPMADRSLLALAYVHELGLAELAEIEGIGVAAAKARLHRARIRLREILQTTPAASDRPASRPDRGATA